MIAGGNMIEILEALEKKIAALEAEIAALKKALKK